MKIIHIFLISCLSVIGVKTGFQPGAVTSPSQAPLPAAGFPNYYMAKGETVTKADFEELYFSANTVFNSPVVSQSLNHSIQDKINTYLKSNNALRVYIIIKQDETKTNFNANIQFMNMSSAVSLFSVSNIPLLGEVPDKIKGLPFEVTGNILTPNLIKFTYRTSRQQKDCSCYIAISWDTNSGAYTGEFIFYSPSYKTQSNMQSAVGSVISNAQQQNSQVDSAETLVKALTGAGFIDSDDWTQYVCPAFQAQAPTDPSAANNPVQGASTQQQQLQQSQRYVNKIAKAFGNGVSCTLPPPSH